MNSYANDDDDGRKQRGDADRAPRKNKKQNSRNHQSHGNGEGGKRRPRRRKVLPPIIPIGEATQRCPSCKLLAPPENFKDAKCLACQVQDFYATI